MGGIRKSMTEREEAGQEERRWTERKQKMIEKQSKNRRGEVRIKKN